MDDRTETCWDPRQEAPHRCPGRCGCYANHACWPGCACNHCLGRHASYPGMDGVNDYVDVAALQERIGRRGHR